MSISMNSYIQGVLDYAKVTKPGHSSPAGADLFEIAESSLLDDAAKQRFHSIVAKLLYLAKRIRPDLLTAVSYLTTRVRAPTVSDNKKLLRALGYLKRTENCSLQLDVGTQPTLQMYVDASFAVHPNRHGHTGVLVFLGNALVFASSKKQKQLAKSSTEAEIIAASDSLDVGRWLCKFLDSLGFQTPCVLFQDNTSAMSLLRQSKASSSFRKFIDIRRLTISSMIQRRELSIAHMPTGNMLADLLTKPIMGQTFSSLRNGLGIIVSDFSTDNDKSDRSVVVLCELQVICVM